MERIFRNELEHASSLYLRQHAHNPVHWQPWSQEILELARVLDRPILISIGYSACHWCHVMERESFEDPQTAAFMNANFINVKVDREERPDLDDIYMEALQALTGSGGWPLNMFLTTSGKPFYGGTYFPPLPAHGRPSWLDVLAFIRDHWDNKRTLVEEQADRLTKQIEGSSRVFQDMQLPADMNNEKSSSMIQLADRILQSADANQGGFGDRPKFPHFSTLSVLLATSHYQQKTSYADHAFRSLDAMLRGGIYDQLGGGLARYSTDEKWFAPHFEKMLYDNALFLDVLSDAYKLNKQEHYRQVMLDILAFCRRELKDESGGFYAAIDADSEGEEGAYYVWSVSEFEKVLGKERALKWIDFWGMTLEGNWEGHNILHESQQRVAFAEKWGMDERSFIEELEVVRQALMKCRQQRVKPATDQKVILAWNSMLLTAFTKAYAALGEETFYEEATALFIYLKKKFVQSGSIIGHQVYAGEVSGHTYLDDAAFFIAACLDYQEISGDQSALVLAEQLTQEVLDAFDSEEGVFLQYTGKHQQDLLFRKINCLDSPMPSANSVMCGNLIRLGVLFDCEAWQVRGKAMLTGMIGAIQRYPLSFSGWAIRWICTEQSSEEWVLTGKKSKETLSQLIALYGPHRIIQTFFCNPEQSFPLLVGKAIDESCCIYRCLNQSCQPPEQSLLEILKPS